VTFPLMGGKFANTRVHSGLRSDSGPVTDCKRRWRLGVANFLGTRASPRKECALTNRCLVSLFSLIVPRRCPDRKGTYRVHSSEGRGAGRRRLLVRTHAAY
jgi:hypothetical protein